MSFVDFSIAKYAEKTKTNSNYLKYYFFLHTYLFEFLHKKFGPEKLLFIHIVIIISIKLLAKLITRGLKPYFSKMTETLD